MAAAAATVPSLRHCMLDGRRKFTWIFMVMTVYGPANQSSDRMRPVMMLLSLSAAVSCTRTQLCVHRHTGKCESHCNTGTSALLTAVTCAAAVITPTDCLQLAQWVNEHGCSRYYWFCDPHTVAHWPVDSKWRSRKVKAAVLLPGDDRIVAYGL